MSLHLGKVDHMYKQYGEMKKQDIAALTQWLKTQPHLPEFTEMQLILFHHSCYYDLELAKTTIINYSNLKTNSSIIQCASEETIRNISSKFLCVILPKRTPANDCVLFWKMLDPRLEVFDCCKVVQLFYIAIILHFHQYGPADGFLVVFDTAVASYGHLLRMSITAVREAMYFLQEAAPLRLKAMHFVNMATVTTHLIAFAKPFMKKEVYESIKLHKQSVESLHEYVPRECLPEELGGELPSCLQLNSEHVENILKNLDFLKWLDTQTIDESKRVDKEGGFFATIQGFFK